MGTDHTIKKIILFDGVCNLCSAAVHFVIKRDSKNNFRFASLQSEFAKKLLPKFNHGHEVTTIVLIDNDKIYFRSDAALEISKGLRGLWPVFFIFKIVPRFLRDFVYDFIAKNRYRWFGKTDACWLPSPDLKSRFVDA